jgi:aspartyl-tRNA(Asn)/glutamyl-tRNA(Gln) amidotransferase subunit A
MTDVTELTIAEAGDLLKRRSISSTELVSATLRRIEETEPAVHAYARVLVDRAFEAAARVDDELGRGDWRGPLHGVPVAIKDICYTKDVMTEAGSQVLSGFVPGHDATVVEMLRSAGAILVGKTVTHEFAYGVNTPPTRCAWNVTCYPGGSSAGSGVAVSVRSAFGAIGTDTGGSIRIPAFVNGIVGLKPTFGRVSRFGVVPLSTSLDHVGPLTRTVEDCAIMLQAIAGHDARDSGSVDEPVPAYRLDLEAGLNGIVVGVERDYFFYDGVADDVRAAVETVIRELDQAGATIVEVELPDVESVTVTEMTILLTEASALHRHLLREHPSDYESATRLMLELGEFVPATHYFTALRARARLRNNMRNAFRTHHLDAMVWPTLPLATVPLEDLSALRRDGREGSPVQAYVHHTYLANLTGQPAMSVPCGLSASGLPLGFQLLGRPFGEAMLFRIARAYERTHSWPALKPPVIAC